MDPAAVERQTFVVQRRRFGVECNAAIAAVKTHARFPFDDPQHHGVFSLEYVHCMQTEHCHCSCHELCHVLRHFRIVTRNSRPVSRHQLGNAVRVCRHFGCFIRKISFSKLIGCRCVRQQAPALQSCPSSIVLMLRRLMLWGKWTNTFVAVSPRTSKAPTFHTPSAMLRTERRQGSCHHVCSRSTCCAGAVLTLS